MSKLEKSFSLFGLVDSVYSKHEISWEYENLQVFFKAHNLFFFQSKMEIFTVD